MQEKREYIKPAFSTDEAVAIIEQHYTEQTIEAISSLPSYDDVNFLIQFPSKAKFILKISNTCWSEEDVDLQNNIIRELDRKDVQKSHLLPAKSQELVVTVTKNNQKHFVRMVSWIPGRVFADFNPPNKDLLFSVGKTLASFHLGLRDFSHDNMKRYSIWDLAHATDVRDQFCFAITDPIRKDLINHIYNAFSQFYCNLQAKQDFPFGLIHGDMNDHNILCDESGNAVVALIDFGDSCLSYLIFDLAILLAYVMLGKQNPFKDASFVISGYSSVSPLSSDQIQAIPLLVQTRLAVSVTMSTHAQLSRPDDPYLLISQAPAWNLLENWSSYASLHPLSA